MHIILIPINQQKACLEKKDDWFDKQIFESVILIKIFLWWDFPSYCFASDITHSLSRGHLCFVILLHFRRTRAIGQLVVILDFDWLV
jgi:hypothetical protein